MKTICSQDFFSRSTNINTFTPGHSIIPFYLYPFYKNSVSLHINTMILYMFTFWEYNDIHVCKCVQFLCRHFCVYNFLYYIVFIIKTVKIESMCTI